jgi:hypothetical protein
MNAYYTHREFLIRELDKLDYNNEVNILEFGTGDGSAEILFEYAKKYPNLKIKAFDNNIDWLTSMKERYELPNYSFEFVSDWNSMLDSYNFLNKYDLLFIDQAPWEARILTLNKLGENSSVVIIHDYDYYNKEITSQIYSVGVGSFFEKYNNKFTLEGNHSMLPPTLILTNKW